MNKQPLIELVNISERFMSFFTIVSIMIRKTDYSLVHQHQQNMPNYIYKELRNSYLLNNTYSTSVAQKSWWKFVITNYDKAEKLDDFNTYKSKIQNTYKT